MYSRLFGCPWIKCIQVFTYIFQPPCTRGWLTVSGTQKFIFQILIIDLLIRAGSVQEAFKSVRGHYLFYHPLSPTFLSLSTKIDHFLFTWRLRYRITIFYVPCTCVALNILHRIAQRIFIQNIFTCCTCSVDCLFIFCSVVYFQQHLCMWLSCFCVIF